MSTMPAIDGFEPHEESRASEEDEPSALERAQDGLNGGDAATNDDEHNHDDGSAPMVSLRFNSALDLTPFAAATSAMLANIDLTGLSKSLAALDVGHLLPDLSKMIIPALDVSQLLPNIPAFATLGLAQPLIDVESLMPKIDFTPFLATMRLPLPDFSSLMPKLDFGPDFVTLLEGLRRKLPPNWADAVDLEKAIEVIQKDGLPLVWVPRAEVVAQVLNIDNRAGRLTALVGLLPGIADDCDKVLTEVEHASLAGQVPLAKKAVQALRDGHHEAAQALAVVVTETAVAQALGGDYKKVKKQVLFDPDLVPFTQLRVRAALAPIAPFYTAWFARSGEPRPETLSRHVSVHQADGEHYTTGNALVAVMLASSVLRALQELQEIVGSAEVDDLDDSA